MLFEIPILKIPNSNVGVKKEIPILKIPNSNVGMKKGIPILKFQIPTLGGY